MYILSAEKHTFLAARSTKGGAVAARQAALPGATRLRRSNEERRMEMNRFNGKAEHLRHQMMLRAGMTGGNPYHNKHIQEFCNYVDYSTAAMGEELRQEISSTIQTELAKQQV